MLIAATWCQAAGHTAVYDAAHCGKWTKPNRKQTNRPGFSRNEVICLSSSSLKGWKGLAVFSWKWNCAQRSSLAGCVRCLWRSRRLKTAVTGFLLELARLRSITWVVWRSNKQKQSRHHVLVTVGGWLCKGFYYILGKCGGKCIIYCFFLIISATLWSLQESSNQLFTVWFKCPRLLFQITE